MAEDLVHVASARVAVPAGQALAFLADPRALASWATGLSEQTVVAPGLVRGILGADGTTTWCRVDPAPSHAVVTYRLGGSPDRLVPRIVAHVMAGDSLGGDSGHCVVSLLAWRAADMDDTRWSQLCAGHEAEIAVVRELLESRHRSAR